MDVEQQSGTEGKDARLGRTYSGTGFVNLVRFIAIEAKMFIIKAVYFEAFG